MPQQIKIIIRTVKTLGSLIASLYRRIRIKQNTCIEKFHAIFKQFYKAAISFLLARLPLIQDRLIQYVYLTRLHKPVGIFLLLWPTLWALWIAAEGLPNLNVLIVFVLGVIIMRSVGCVINDLADRDLDRHVARTRLRPITSGAVTPSEALGLVTILLIIAAMLASTLNMLTFKLSFVGVALAVIYPFMKRITYIPQIFLGLAFGWAVPMAFAAQTNTISEIVWLLYMTVVLWAIVYDTMYAMADKSDDLEIGIKSTAILFDDADRCIIGIIQLMILCAQILIGIKLGLTSYYYASVFVASLLSLYQQYLIKDKFPEDCLRAFMNNQWYGMVIFIGLYLDYFFR